MNEGQDTGSDMTSLAVSLGRIEEKVSHLDKFDDRLRAVEEAVTKLTAQQPAPKTPWWAVWGGVAGIASAVAVGLALLSKLL